MTHPFEIPNRSLTTLQYLKNVDRLKKIKIKIHVLLIEAFLVGARPGVILAVWYRTMFGHLSSVIPPRPAESTRNKVNANSCTVVKSWRLVDDIQSAVQASDVK